MAAQHQPKHSRLSFSVVQCVAGGVVLLLGLLLRAMDGAWYNSVRNVIQPLFMDTALVETVCDVFARLYHV